MIDDRETLALLERCFIEGECETLVWRESRGTQPGVKIVHKPTGIESVSEHHKSQVRNKIQALVDLISKLMERAEKAD